MFNFLEFSPDSCCFHELCCLWTCYSFSHLLFTVNTSLDKRHIKESGTFYKLCFGRFCWRLTIRSCCGECDTSVYFAPVHGKCVSLRKCLVTFYYLSSAGHHRRRGMLGNVVFGACIQYSVCVSEGDLQCVLSIYTVSFSVSSTIMRVTGSL